MAAVALLTELWTSRINPDNPSETSYAVFTVFSWTWISSGLGSDCLPELKISTKV